MEIINFQKEKMTLLSTKKRQNTKMFYITEDKIDDKRAKDKQYTILGTIVIIQLNIEVMHIAYVIYRIVYLNKFL